MNYKPLLAIASAFLFAYCTPKPKGFEPDAGTMNLSKVIAVGGSYMAGYQDGALSTKGQQNSLAALVANQLQMAGGSKMYQVLMPEDKGVGLNAKPWEGSFVTPSKLGYKTDCKGVSSLSPLKSSISEIAALQYLSNANNTPNANFAVPFAALSDYTNVDLGLSYGLNNKNPFYNRIASKPGESTLLSDIKAQNPSFVISWLGMDEIYNYASKGGANEQMISASELEQHLDEIIGTLAKSGTKGVLATIPDFRVFPFYTLVPWDNADITQDQADELNAAYAPNSAFNHIHFAQGRNGFIVADAAHPSGFRQLKQGEFITLAVPLDSLKCFKYGLLIKVINDRYTLIESEINKLDNAITTYNQVITKKAAEYGWALADINYYMNTVKTGVKWNGADFNMEFVSGGFLSLDGYHPNQKGYALLANEFIKAINKTYGANIPQTTCQSCDGVLFN